MRNEEYITKQLYDNQTSFIIKSLMESKSMSLKDAIELWYRSKTRQAIQKSGTDLSFVSRTRCYDELLMELENNPMWMRVSFE